MVTKSNPNTDGDNRQEGAVSLEFAAEGFIAWLQTFDPCDLVGLPRDAENNPLALYLQQELTGHATEVDWDSLILPNWQRVPTPVWVKDFLACVDVEPKEISARSALRFMAYALHGFSVRGKRCNLYQRKD